MNLIESKQFLKKCVRSFSIKVKKTLKDSCSVNIVFEGNFVKLNDVDLKSFGSAIWNAIIHNNTDDNNNMMERELIQPILLENFEYRHCGWRLFGNNRSTCQY